MRQSRAQGGLSHTAPLPSNPVVAAAPATASSGLLLGARWSQFGRHKVYGNGQPRAFLRGWLHLVVLICGVSVLVDDAPEASRLSPQAARFAWATLVGYLGSVVFHVVPWATLRTFQLALAFDFCTITLAFSGQIGALIGFRSLGAAASLLITACIASLCAAGLHSGGEPLWLYRRHARKVLMILQIGLSCAVEAVAITDKRMAAAIGLLKAACFQFFATFARYDAPRSFALAFPPFWDNHDTFHVMTSVVHALQILAVHRQTRGA